MPIPKLSPIRSSTVLKPTPGSDARMYGFASTDGIAWSFHFFHASFAMRIVPPCLRTNVTHSVWCLFASKAARVRLRAIPTFCGISSRWSRQVSPYCSHSLSQVAGPTPFDISAA